MKKATSLALATIVAVTLFTMSGAPPRAMAQAASAVSGSSVRIDRPLFLATVPSYAVIGLNYTVKVLVRNNASSPVPIVLWIVAPVDSVLIRPYQIFSVVPANQGFLANFSLVAFHQPASGHNNVTAVLSVWAFTNMSRPQVVQQVNAVMFSAAPSSAALVVEAGATGAFLVAITGCFAYLIRQRRKMTAESVASVR